ncbi:HAMP domain-containing sensor histidine kinase [Neomegalonema sp.]|uniref:sensor histidine kinase n=1 Tax=Neomegalonema sp. TaxID=2039713 RepID=UPI002611FCBE|nr:HAMP domain-containing sensor histidine kinase [Neomegalonema sp.]MDD2869395.1 HAMP domain-containing sensor histidine kinase [Neomegalonema sp.]
MPHQAPPFAETLDPSPALWVWDGARRRILAANRRGLEVWGEEAVPDLAERDFAPQSAATRMHEELERRARVLAESGGEGRASLRASFSPQGRPIVLDCVGRLVESGTGRRLLHVEARPAGALDAGLERAAAGFAEAPLALVLFGENGEALAQNFEAERLFGPLSTQEPYGLGRILRSEEGPAMLMRGAFLDGAYSAAVPVATREGARRMRISARRIEDPAGFAAVLAGFSEIPDRRLEAVFSAVPAPTDLRAGFGAFAAALDQTGRVQDMPAAAAEIFGRKPEELRGLSMEGLLDAEGGEALIHHGFGAGAALFEGAALHSGRRLLLALGPREPLRETRMLNILPLPGPARAASVPESALARLGAVEALSHGLRDPLNLLMGRLDMLRLQAREAGAEEEAGSLADAHEGAKAMARLIDQVLDWRRMEQGDLRLDTRPTDLAALVRRLAAEAQSPAARRGVGLVAAVDPDLPFVLTDPNVLGRALELLLGEALRLTPAGGSTRIGVWRDMEGGARLEVMDTGPGYAPEEIAESARPFGLPIPVAGGGFGGEGMNLALARRLAEACGAQFVLTSEKGVGAVASLVFPPVRRAPV